MSREKKVPSEKGLTKTALVGALAEKTGLTKVQVGKALEVLAELADKELHRAGQFAIPGIVLLKAKLKAATAARPGRNPKTGEAITISAKPAKIVVRAQVKKDLKKSWA